MSIPADRWVWDGHAGHFIGSRSCQFHLNTRIGGYIVSTVGEYRLPKGHPVDGKSIGGEEYAEFESIGLGRLFETYVFRASGEGYGEVDEFVEVDALNANDHDTANRNHMALCQKYAELQS